MLQEQDRQKLDGIVRQMVQNKESDKNIKALVEDFKARYDNGAQSQTQTPVSTAPKGPVQVLQKPQDTFLEGGPLSRGLKGAANFLGSLPLGKSFAQGAYLNFTSEGRQLKKDIAAGKITENELVGAIGTEVTNKQVVGSAAQTALNVLPLGKAASPAINSAKAVGLGKASEFVGKRVAGAAVGYGFDVAGSLTDGKSIGESLKPGLGTVIGAIIGISPVKPKDPNKVSSLAKKLEETSMRLTPVDKQNLAKQGKDLLTFATKLKLTGNPEQRYAKIVAISDAAEETAQTIIKDSGAKFSKQGIIDAIQKAPERYIDDPTAYDETVSAVKKITAFIQSKLPDVIDGKDLNAIKRNLSKRAYAKNNTDIVSDSLKSISDTIYEVVAEQIPELKRFNQNHYQYITTLKHVLFKAQSRPQIGLVGKMVGIGTSSSLGGAVAGPLGAAVGMAMGTQVGKAVAGTKARSLLGVSAQKIQEAVNKLPQVDGNVQISKKILLDIIQRIR